MRNHFKNLLITITIFLFFLLLDQITKYLTQINISYEGTEKSAFTIDGFISIYKVYNTGMGWSLLDDEKGHIILLCISFVASIVLAIFCDHNDWKHAKTLSLGKTLVLAGCVGNLFDRLICIIPGLNDKYTGRPGVVDMVSWDWFDALTGLFGLGNTVFNVADMALTTGLVLVIFDLIFFYSRREKKYGKEANA